MKHRRFIVILLAAALHVLHDCKAQLAVRAPVAMEALIAQVSEEEILATVRDLQAFGIRKMGTQGNRDAAAYLFKRFAAIPGLAVAYQGGARAM